jgi:hypothetical protein
MVATPGNSKAEHNNRIYFSHNQTALYLLKLKNNIPLE